MKKTILLTLIIALFLGGSSNAVLADQPEKLQAEIVIYAGEPEGVAAAVAAAREGKKTLLLLSRSQPGGLMTYAGLNFLDLNYDSYSRNINRGIFHEWHQKVGGGISFDPRQAEDAFLNLIKAEKNLKTLNLVRLEQVNSKDQNITGLLIKRNGKKYLVKADIFIDASQDGDLAYKAGEDFFVGTADMNLKNSWMASTQILKFEHVNPNKLKAKIKNYQQSYFKADHAWGFSNFGKSYQSHNPNLRLRGLNIVFVRDGEQKYTAYINALLLFGVNPLSDDSREQAKKIAHQEARYILNYLKEGLAGFENAELAAMPPELYRRESRHFLTNYQLKIADLFEQRVFSDAITIASYPLDYQAAGIKYPGFVLFNPGYYTIPLRTLIARHHDNLMIVGRSSGYASLAAASARVLPVGINTGQAAGVAAAESISKAKPLLAVAADSRSINKIQQQLELNLTELPAKLPIVKLEKVNDDLIKLLSWGIMIGGYNNDFKLNEVPTERNFTAVILKIMQKKEAATLYEWVPGSLETLSSKDKLLTTTNALKLLLAAESQRVLEIPVAEYYQKAVELNLIPPSLLAEFNHDKKLKRSEMIILAAHFLDRFPTPEYLKFIRGE